MEDNINRDHIYSIMDWVEAEQEEKNKQHKIAKLSAEKVELKMDADLKKYTALNEMYGMIILSNEDHIPSRGRRVCHEAFAMVYMCFKLGYINENSKKEYEDYLNSKLHKFILCEQE